MIIRDTMQAVVELPFEGGKLAFITDGSLKEPTADALVVNIRSRAWGVIDGAGEKTGRLAAEILSKTFDHHLRARRKCDSPIPFETLQIRATEKMKQAAMRKQRNIGACVVAGQLTISQLLIARSGDCEALLLDRRSKKIINRIEQRNILAGCISSHDVEDQDMEIYPPITPFAGLRVIAYTDGIPNNCKIEETDEDLWHDDPRIVVRNFHARAKTNGQKAKDAFMRTNPEKRLAWTDPETEEKLYSYYFPTNVDHLTMLVCDID